jgi:hypothetical protein
MARTIFSILDDLSRGLQDLRTALSPIMALGGGAPAPARAAAPARAGRRRRRGRPPGSPNRRAKAKAPAARPAAKRRRQRPASPKLKALRALQGRYMGAVRHLSPSQKSQVKKVRADSGYDAALKLASSLSKSQG